MLNMSNYLGLREVQNDKNGVGYLLLGCGLTITVPLE